jgi:hypothetical protein
MCSNLWLKTAVVRVTGFFGGLGAFFNMALAGKRTTGTWD